MNESDGEPDYDADYLFKVSLQMSHPTMHPDTVTQALGIKPRRSWLVGEQRTTPNGTPLEGHHKETYWTISERFERRRDFFAACLEFVGRVLEPQAAFLSHFTATGGDVNLNVSLVGDTNSGDALAPEAFSRLARLGITLGIEVFPDMN